MHFTQKQKDSCLKIESWYQKLMLPKNTDDIKTKKNMVRFYALHYPTEHLLAFPAFMQRKLKRSDLPDIIPEKRSQAIKFLNLPAISLSDICYAGW